MDISNLKQVVMSGPEDGQTIAMVWGKVAYLVQAHGMSEAMDRMKREKNIDTNEWILTNAKAVLIPGLWEYELAVCNRGMGSQQVFDLVQELQEVA